MEDDAEESFLLRRPRREARRKSPWVCVGVLCGVAGMSLGLAYVDMLSPAAADDLLPPYFVAAGWAPGRRRPPGKRKPSIPMMEAPRHLVAAWWRRAAAARKNNGPPDDQTLGHILAWLVVSLVALVAYELGLRRRWRSDGGGDDDDDDAVLSTSSKKVSFTARWDVVDRFTVLARGGRLVAAYVVAAVGIVYCNAYVLAVWPHPATLTALQLTFCSMAAWAMALLGLAAPQRVVAEAGASRVAALVVPLAVLYATFLYGSNAAYEYLDVGFIQMVKISQAAFVYAFALFFRSETFDPAAAANLAVILGAVAVASAAKANDVGKRSSSSSPSSKEDDDDGDWSTVGLGLVVGSNAAYALYLVLQQVYFVRTLGAAAAATSALSPAPGKIDSVTVLCLVGPPTALCLFAVAFCREWGAAGGVISTLFEPQPVAAAFPEHWPSSTSTWSPAAFVLVDCLLALALNLIQIAIVTDLSALTYMFAGYAKGLVTVLISVAAFKEALSPVEAASYALMLAAQALWSARKILLGGRAPLPSHFPKRRADQAWAHAKYHPPIPRPREDAASPFATPHLLHGLVTANGRHDGRDGRADGRRPDDDSDLFCA